MTMQNKFYCYIKHMNIFIILLSFFKMKKMSMQKSKADSRVRS